MLYPYPAPIINALLAMIVAQGGLFGPYIVVHKNARTEYRKDLVYVKEVYDGDTFKLDSGEHVRLAEVNAPEIGECYGEEAKAALTKVLSDKPLRLIHDEVDRDKFGRLLRIVQIETNDGEKPKTTVQEYLATRGYLQSEFHENRAYQKGIEKAEKSARENKVGMWKDCKKEVAKKEEETRLQYTTKMCRRVTRSA
jgi:endonuclease YncB( thermonuclease family)